MFDCVSLLPVHLCAQELLRAAGHQAALLQMDGEAKMMKCVHRQLSVGNGLPNRESQNDQIVDVNGDP